VVVCISCILFICSCFFSDFSVYLFILSRRFSRFSVVFFFFFFFFFFCEKMALPNPPSFVSHEGWSFLIFDAPTNSNLDIYIKEMMSHNVVALGRACEPSYATDKLKEHNIEVYELEFADGGFPPDNVIDSWLELCYKVFGTSKKGDSNKAIGVHCVAGLGRAPVLVAIALMERGMPYSQAVEIIRQKRRGAINSKQLAKLKEYKPKKRGKNGGGCVIM